MKVTVVDAESLREDPKNARRHGERNVAAIRASLKQFGQRLPIVVRGGVVYGGNGTLRAMRELGLAKVATVSADDLDERGARALALALNRTAELAEWDEEKLVDSLREVSGAQFDEGILGGLEGLADLFEESELKKLVKISGHLRALPGDDAPADREPPKVPVAKRGDVWQLGRHRVHCSDARTSTIGEGVQLVLTDPPYCSGGFQEAGKAAGTYGDIASDQLSTRGYQALMREAFGRCTPKAAYVFTDWRMWIPLFDVVEASGLPVKSMIVWDKESPGMGTLWRTQHELLMFASREGKKRRKKIPACGNVLKCKRSGNVHHYTEKPVDLLVQVLEGDAASTRARCAVYDPFLGSGSTLLAAERCARACLGVEVEPGYVDVVVERWQEMTGKKATRSTSTAAA